LIQRLAILAGMLAAFGAPLPGAHAAPATLTCVDSGMLNPRAAPVETAVSDDDLGATLIHVDPATGEWFLQVPGSRALTNGGGAFEVLRTSAFERYHDEWVGIDDDTMLRIRGGGGGALSFVFVSHRDGFLAGTCSEPEEPFLFLGGGDG
jgi:hypothetical protein